MFKFIFYFFGIVAILWEFISLYNYDKLQAIKVRAKKAELGEAKFTSTDSALGICMVLYFIWNMVGIFTSQWVIFISIFILSMFNGVIKGKVWNAIDSVITIALIMFAIVNTYHFHINLWKPISDFLLYLTT